MSQAQHRTTTESPVAIVTGAGRRLGNVIARELAADGYRLALHAHQSSADLAQTVFELVAGGTEAIALAADLRDEQATRDLIAQAHARFGRIDALVNSAAIWVAKPFEKITAADVREHFEINTLGTFVASQAAGLIMAAQSSGGAIVNIGDWAIERPYLNYAAYFVAKGAIPTLTRALAVELAHRNPRVRVNAVLPGPVLLPTEMSAAERQRVIEATLAKREGSPRDVADAVRFLLQNTFVTGVCLPVDGGRSIYSPTDSH
jgi:pteridine reductase